MCTGSCSRHWWEKECEQQAQEQRLLGIGMVENQNQRQMADVKEVSLEEVSLEEEASLEEM